MWKRYMNVRNYKKACTSTLLVLIFLCLPKTSNSEPLDTLPQPPNTQEAPLPKKRRVSKQQRLQQNNKINDAPTMVEQPQFKKSTTNLTLQRLSLQSAISPENHE